MAVGAEKIARDIDFLYSMGRTRQDWWSFDDRVRYERDPAERFFGIGNHSHSANETNFTTEQLFVEARLGLNLSHDVQLAARTAPPVYQHSTRRILWYPLYRDVLSAPERVGMSALFLKFHALRKNPTAPEHVSIGFSWNRPCKVQCIDSPPHPFVTY